MLISHAHGDHDAATGIIKKETDAKLMVMDADVAEEESTARGRPGAHVDRTLHDGELVEAGQVPAAVSVKSLIYKKLSPGNGPIGVKPFAACHL